MLTTNDGDFLPVFCHLATRTQTGMFAYSLHSTASSGHISCHILQYWRLANHLTCEIQMVDYAVLVGRIEPAGRRPHPVLMHHELQEVRVDKIDVACLTVAIDHHLGSVEQNGLKAEIRYRRILSPTLLDPLRWLRPL